MVSTKKILVIVSHPDDEVLGCGGAVAKYVKSGADVQMAFLADGVNSRMSDEESSQQKLIQRRDCAQKACKILGVSKLIFCDFPDNEMDKTSLLELARRVEAHVADFEPTIVITHFPADLNVDHRLTSQAVLIACRPKAQSYINTLLYFEVSSSTEWNFGAEPFVPNVFINILNSLNAKEAALQSYCVEINDYPNARSLEGIRAKAIFRGVTAGFPYAEAFQLGFHLI